MDPNKSSVQLSPDIIGDLKLYFDYKYTMPCKEVYRIWDLKQR